MYTIATLICQAGFRQSARIQDFVKDTGTQKERSLSMYKRHTHTSVWLWNPVKIYNSKFYLGKKMTLIPQAESINSVNAEVRISPNKKNILPYPPQLLWNPDLMCTTQFKTGNKVWKITPNILTLPYKCRLLDLLSKKHTLFLGNWHLLTHPKVNFLISFSGVILPCWPFILRTVRFITLFRLWICCFSCFGLWTKIKTNQQKIIHTHPAQNHQRE